MNIIISRFGSFRNFKPSRLRLWLTLTLGVTAFYSWNTFKGASPKTLTHYPNSSTIHPPRPSNPTVSRWAQMPRWRRGLLYTIRLLQLFTIFLPPLLLIPFLLFKSLRNVWTEVLIWSVRQAGVVWIKALQYISHRRDVVGSEIADRFAVLREDSPRHSQSQTQKIFERVYKSKPSQFFEQFSAEPIASGSVSQVYLAKYCQQPVAVKVRHPNVQENIEKDVQLMFIVSHTLSKLSQKFELPTTEDSLRKILVDQIDFTRQQDNLVRFNAMFTGSNIRFPTPKAPTTQQVLVQSFAQGKPITYYESHTHELNRGIAMYGAIAFFEMLMKHNFVHADCHGGNILVRFTETSWLHRLKDYWRQVKLTVLGLAVWIGSGSQMLHELSRQNLKYEKQVRSLIRQSNRDVQITLLDVGMVIELDERKKKEFKAFLTEIVKGDPKGCAEKIYQISMKSDKYLAQGQFPEYLNDLEDIFSILKRFSLAALPGIDVLVEMLKVIRRHNMKIDGEISILLTNMLILEAIAKSLDPTINILRCAVPYLHNM